MKKITSYMMQGSKSTSGNWAFLSFCQPARLDFGDSSAKSILTKVACLYALVPPLIHGNGVKYNGEIK